MNWTTNSYNYMLYGNAEVAELADAHGSGPCGSNTMRVQVPPPARTENGNSLPEREAVFVLGDPDNGKSGPGFEKTGKFLRHPAF